MTETAGASPTINNRAPTYIGDATTVLKTENAEGSMHSYSQDEKVAIVEHINNLLKDDPQLRYLVPIDPEGDAIFTAVNDGVLIW